MDSKRFLRKPALRNALYRSADGRCQHCGTPLPDDWHADHVEPWSKTHRTNLFGMQALCPDCNRTKGARMNSSVSINLNTPPMRPGQRTAIQVIWDIIRTRRKSTATIVLPTRYGKSDVIRASAVGLMADNLVSRAVILEPASNLVTQVLDKASIALAVERYSLPFGHGLQTFAVRDTPRRPFPPRWAQGAHFIAMTTQMANSNRDFFAEWIEEERMRHGCAPVWYIDECHTGSRDNEWGKTVRALQGAGAFLVLLTATPYRTDKSHVEGFRYEEVGRDTRIARLGTGLFEQERIRYELEADHITSFQEAWDERPQPLCYLARITIDPPLRRYRTLMSERRADRVLSELSVSDAHRTLSILVRDDDFVDEAVDFFMEALSKRRAVFEETAGMVYVGSDTPGDEANAHALQVERALRVLDKDLDIIIATAATEDAAEQLSAFQQGKGDVLIVKQMGGVGMDVPRLKVVLDLSTVRTLNAFVQRVCRPLTMWNPTGAPEDLVQTATYITPADALARNLWEEFVVKEGGDAETRVTLEYLGEGVSDLQPPLPDTFVFAGGTRVGDMTDSQQRRAPGDQWSAVQKLIGVFPELTKSRTEPELANAVTEHNIVFGDEPPQPTLAGDAPTEAPQSPKVVDLYAEQKAAREVVNRLARQVARKRMGRGVMDERFGEVIKAVYVEHKRKCGLRWEDGASLKDLSVEQLNKLADSIGREIGE